MTKMISTYRGIPLTEMTKEQLIEAIERLGKEEARQRKRADDYACKYIFSGIPK